MGIWDGKCELVSVLCLPQARSCWYLGVDHFTFDENE